MKRSAVLATIIALGLVFHADAKSYTPVFTEDFENAATWHDNVQYGSVSNAYLKMTTLNLGGTEYQLSQAERMLSDGVSTTKFYQQASSNNQKRNSAFIIPDSVLTSLGNDYMLEFDLGFNAPYTKNSSTDYRAGLSINDANGLPLLTIGTVYGNGDGEKNTGYIYRGDDIDDAIASNFRVTGRNQVITNSVYAKNWLHVKLTVSGSSMSVTATLADGTVLCSDAAVSTGCVLLHVEGHHSSGVPDGRGGVSLYGDNTDFEGICYIKSGASSRGPATFCSATAGSAKARWVFLDSADGNQGAKSGTIAVENPQSSSAPTKAKTIFSVPPSTSATRLKSAERTQISPALLAPAVRRPSVRTTVRPSRKSASVR